MKYSHLKQVRNWCCFISGEGSNLQVLLDDEVANVSLVVSSNPNAYGLKRVYKKNIPSIVLGRTPDYGWLLSHLNVLGIDGIFCLGFMKIIPESFLKHWNGLILNLHPSVLPECVGANALECSFKDTSKSIGATIHHVTSELDNGPIVIQEAVCGPGERVESLDFYKNKVSQLEKVLVKKVVSQCYPPL